jgi:hypothetical protein
MTAVQDADVTEGHSAADPPPDDARAAPAPSSGTSTATGPTVRSTARSVRGPLLALAALVLLSAVAGVLSAAGPGGRLDPAAATPAGSRAVAQVLRGLEVPVTRVDTVDAVEAADAADRTVVVPRPEALAPSELQRLGRLEAGLVVVGADEEQLGLLGLPVQVEDAVEVEPRRAACDLPVAARAGTVDLGGLTYRGRDGVPATGCYAAGGEATLLHLPEQDAVLLGDGTLLTNDRLDERGNAALALGLLGERPGGVLWLVPRPGRPVPDERSLADLLPDALGPASLQLLVAAAVLALWRARRLGRVVEEPLPVVVRAAEAVEGRGRLYRAAGARAAAADALRAAVRERVGQRAGVPTSAGRGELVTVVAERTGDDPAVVEALLYGGPPADDAALVRLADDLTVLETTLTGPGRSSTAAPETARTQTHDTEVDGS